MFTGIIRLGSYPIILGLTSTLQILIAAGEWSFWPFAPIIAFFGICSAAIFERMYPFVEKWNHDNNDTFQDILHAIFSLTLIFSVLDIIEFFRSSIPLISIWPSAAPIWSQVFLAGLILDFGIWFMHWLSHKKRVLWKLHALHHSSERLYWLNGERRHPLSALLLASPGLAVTLFLGVPSEVIGCWFSIMAVHLAFQHSNFDYSVGVFRNLIGVAEIHRWHHKRDYSDAQVNYGEFWMIWDHIFGTFRYQVNGVKEGDVGMQGTMPAKYLDQIKWPFMN